jgi:hypothetical protein
MLGLRASSDRVPPSGRRKGMKRITDIFDKNAPISVSQTAEAQSSEELYRDSMASVIIINKPMQLKV